MLQPGEVVADRFEVEELAGQGGMGAVFSAKDRHSQAKIALKVLSQPGEAQADRFLREAKLLSEIRHPGIVRYIAHGQTPEGQCYLAMEWLEGEDLAKRLSRAGLTVEESVRLIERVAEILGVVHARGVVHRDLKPHNLFLPGNRLEEVKVIDFGIARLAQVSKALTQAGSLLGTLGYIAPEQARGTESLDARADVFSLGCILFECLSGKPAFSGDHVMALLAKILIDEAPRVSAVRPDIPPALDALVASMLEKDPARRPAHGAEVADRLRALPSRQLGDLPRAPASPLHEVLTESERRLLCVVIIGQAQGEPVDTSRTQEQQTRIDPRPAFIVEEVATLVQPNAASAVSILDRLKGVVEGFGGQLQPLADGSLVATLWGAGVANDQAQKGARCALALRDLCPDAPISLAMGRSEVARWSIGEVIDRAAKMLPERQKGRVSPRPVRLDEVTAGLLDARFEVGGDEGGLLLFGEREVLEVARTLLGKETPFVGRERELSALEALFAECEDEPASRVALLVAPAGVGKSRLRYEFLRRINARASPVEILIGRGDSVRAGSPFGLIAPALRRFCRIQDGEPLEIRQRKLRARVGRYLTRPDQDRVVEFLGELIAVPFPGEQSPPPARRAPHPEADGGPGPARVPRLAHRGVPPQAHALPPRRSPLGRQADRAPHRRRAPPLS